MMTTITALLLSLQVTLTLSTEAHVTGTEMSLDEVAELSGDAAMVNTLSSFKIGYAPSPGFSRLLQGWRLEQNIERAHPGLDIVLAGTPACRVWPQTALVSAAQIEAAARELLQPALAKTDATAVLVGELGDIQVPGGSTPPVVRPAVSEIELRTGIVTVPVRIDVDGSSYRTLRTQWSIEQWQVLPVLVREVPAGARIEFSMLENRRVKARTGNAAKPLPAGLAVGGLAVRDLHAGTVITEDDLHRPKIVAEGDRIYLAIRKGPVVAKVAATALDAGAIGERIRVKTNNQRELMAVVIGRDLVELDLTIGS